LAKRSDRNKRTPASIHFPFIQAGKAAGKIPVRISYRIIELFSEGLYSSPHKAIEELVSNSFDAGATHVHIILGPDRAAPDAIIAVIDDGTGMTPADLRRHWLIGVSNKRDLAGQPVGRHPIGKFGIGKLATFVLAKQLTHVCKVKGKFFATTMDFSKIPQGQGGGIHAEETVDLPLRELTETQAKEALATVIDGVKPGYHAIELFGRGAAGTWTVAVLSGLKNMAQEIQKGRLSWVLRTAMPLRDDFKLYLDGDALPPSKSDTPPLQKWILGKDLRKLPKPSPDDLEVSVVKSASLEHRNGLVHPKLGRVTGYAEVYESALTEGKSAEIGRSHGFFVYVRGRLVNIEDELFGMAALRHGTFARFRMVVHIDRLDVELRSSREAVREGTLIEIARNILHAVFNYARKWLEERDAKEAPGTKATGRIADSPWSLTRRPLLGLLNAALDGKVTPRHLAYPTHLGKSARERLLQELNARAETDEGLVLSTDLVDLSQHDGFAVLDMEMGTLQINGLHPFVAAHREEYERGRETLSLLAMAEVLTEAHLYEVGVVPATIAEIMQRRDELLRYFARSMKRTAYMVAQALEDAVTDQDRLEEELVAAFDSMGFSAVRIGGKGKPDGKAEASLGAVSDGTARRYAISLEAKSKEVPGNKVSARTVNVSNVALHREEYACDHAIVVGPDFPTGQGDESSLVKQVRANEAQTGKTITVVRTVDLARLVRLVPVKGIGLNRLREFFTSCISTQDARTWIDHLQAEKPPQPPYGAILATIWALQEEVPAETVEFSAVATALRKDKGIVMPKNEIAELCRAMSRMTTHVVVRDPRVELTQRPDRIIHAAGAVLQKFPEEEQKRTIFRVTPSRK
jgi:Histidine kinase-, DNA gyrase B-, and HSP90-like ATPase